MTFKRKLFEFDRTSFDFDCRTQTYNTFDYTSLSSSSTSFQQTNHNSWKNVLSWILKFFFISNELKWKTRTFVVIAIGILVLIFRGESRNHRDAIPLAIEPWDRNHFNGGILTERNLLIVQFYDQSTISWLYPSSKPNRAYARHWGMDYLHTYDLDCPAQLVLDIYNQQQGGNAEEDSVYDAILILAPNAMITDMDYDILALLPENQVATVTTNGELLRMFNLRHEELPNVLTLWSTCESTLQEAVSTVFSDSILRINPSMAGFVEPRLIRFVDNPTMLQTTSDSVCYRYYPRCDVLYE
jgi:hypothetical protein